MDKEFLENLGLSAEVAEAILAEQEKLDTAHQAQVAQLQLQHGVQLAVQRHGGRNVKAISALLDMEKIGAEEDVSAALESAVKQLKKEHSYLFEAEKPPVYARNTGAGNGLPPEPTTLAGALRERMRKELKIKS